MKTTKRNIRSICRGLSAILLISLLTACGDYGGGGVRVSNPGQSASTVPQGLDETAQVAAFTATVHPVVTLYCADGCHDTGSRGAPFLFANSSPGTAYTVLTQSKKVDLVSPSSSRIVRRPAADFHECGSQCVQIGAEMLAAVEAWALIYEEATEGNAVAVDGIVSGETAYTDGEIEENGERYSTNLLALWEFKEGSGDRALDTSGVDPLMHLHLEGGYRWMDSYGLALDEAWLWAGADFSLKLTQNIAAPGTGTGQYSVELWITNGNITQEDATIVSYQQSRGDQNFGLYQQEYQYEFRNRSLAPESGLDGRQELLTYDVDQDAQETLQHVVLTYDPLNGRKIYVDGVFTDDFDPLVGAKMWNWETSQRLNFGSRRNGNDDFWLGQLRMAAIYRHALTDQQIQKNLQAGVGKRVRLIFDLKEWTGGNDELRFSVTSLDDYSYLFCQPTFVGPNISGMRVKNMKVLVNPSTNTIPDPEGQAFSNMNEVITGSPFQASRNCSIIKKQDGTTLDSFAVVFEQLGYFEDEEDDTIIDYQISTEVLPPLPATGFRDFARIHTTMAALTGVDPLAPRFADPAAITIQEIYEGLAEQLPSTVDARAVSSSHQVAVTKLSFEYCVEMVDRQNLREAVFGTEFETGTPSFFDSDVTTAFSDPVTVDLLRDRLVDHVLGVQQIDNQPLRALVIQDLDQLIVELTAQCGACDAERTRSIAKGLCAGVLASAPIMVH